MLSIEPHPTWAFSWCWFFFAASSLSAITAILTLVTIVVMFNQFSKDGSLPLLGSYVLVLVIQSITSMVTFWMCRASLKPDAK